MPLFGLNYQKRPAADKNATVFIIPDRPILEMAQSIILNARGRAHLKECHNATVAVTFPSFRRVDGLRSSEQRSGFYRKYLFYEN